MTVGMFIVYRLIPVAVPLVMIVCIYWAMLEMAKLVLFGAL